MRPTKIRDEQEVIRWIDEGRTYAWMAQQYLEKYGIEVAPTTFSNFRQRMGMEPRKVWNDELVPWYVEEHHRHTHPVMMLRAEARRRAGKPIADASRLDSWLASRKQEDTVVHYDPDTEQGFFYVLRRPGVDTDLIRVPDPSVRRRRPRAAD